MDGVPPANTEMEHPMNLTFPTKAAQQDELTALNRRYDAARKEITELCLSAKHADRNPAKVDELYWALPFDLHNYRAKHGALAVSVFPETASIIARIEALFAERAVVKAAPVVKVAKLDKADPAVVAVADKTQTRGNCPCCGREQAVLASGRMSKHGYTVEHNWFNGVCDGERFAPMQVQREVTDAIVAQVRAEVSELLARAADLRARRADPATITQSNGRGKEPTIIQFASLNQYQQANAIESLAYNAEARARAGRDFADFMAELVNKVHGQPLKVVAL